VSWFDKHNEGRSYSDQVRPSNFMLAYQISPIAIHQCPEFMASIADATASRPKPIKLPRPVAPFDRDPAKAAEACFDRETGITVPIRVLKTYKDALAQYHMRPEHKFLNGNYTDRGLTQRRHVKPTAIRNIGKESNRWEEKFYLGSDDGAEINYGLAPQDSEAFLDSLRTQVVVAGQRKIARESGVSRRTLACFMQGGRIRSGIITRLVRAARERKNRKLITGSVDEHRAGHGQKRFRLLP